MSLSELNAQIVELTAKYQALSDRLDAHLAETAAQPEPEFRYFSDGDSVWRFGGDVHQTRHISDDEWCVSASLLENMGGCREITAAEGES